jgi:hypothetical protein
MLASPGLYQAILSNLWLLAYPQTLDADKNVNINKKSFTTLTQISKASVATGNWNLKLQMTKTRFNLSIERFCKNCPLHLFGLQPEWRLRPGLNPDGVKVFIWQLPVSDGQTCLWNLCQCCKTFFASVDIFVCIQCLRIWQEWSTFIRLFGKAL